MILKKRITKSREVRRKRELQSFQAPLGSEEYIAKTPKPTRKSNSRTGSLSMLNAGFHTKSTKNIIKNYARAICYFVVSKDADKYLDRVIVEENIVVSKASLVKYFSAVKDMIDNIEKFKSLLTISNKNSNEENARNTVFKELAQIFIKFFATQWIYQGRLSYKKSHLDNRLKMLRRIQNPDLFVLPNRKGRGLDALSI